MPKAPAPSPTPSPVPSSPASPTAPRPLFRPGPSSTLLGPPPNLPQLQTQLLTLLRTWSLTDFGKAAALVLPELGIPEPGPWIRTTHDFGAHIQSLLLTPSGLSPLSLSLLGALATNRIPVEAIPSYLCTYAAALTVLDLAAAPATPAA
jgi:hypothetical protein